MVATCEQLRGMYLGYRSQVAAFKPKMRLTRTEFYYLTYMGDLEDLNAYYGKRERNKECTGFVKLVDGGKNIVAAHNTHKAEAHKPTREVRNGSICFHHRSMPNRPAKYTQ